MNCARTPSSLGVARGIAEAAEGEGEVGLVLGHRVEQVLHQRLVAVTLR